MEDANVHEPLRESDNRNFASAYTKTPRNLNRESANIVIGNDMMAVARRIQERAQVLQDERKKAEAKRVVLFDLCQKRDAEKITNEKQRKRLLQATNERNAVELEIMGARESIEDCWKRTRVMEEETRESEERTRKLEEERAEITKSLFGPNLAEMEMFLKVLENIVDSKEKAVEARRKRMEDLRTQLDDSKQKEETILRETEETKMAIKREEGVYQDETDKESTESESSNKSDNNGKKRMSIIAQTDNEIDNLSSRVRETIEMRSTLRQKLRAAQKKYDEANKDMIFWQAKRIERLTVKK